ncbi:MAG: hypothetical protein U0R71_11165 [Solirubrobacterales bacterium]
MHLASLARAHRAPLLAAALVLIVAAFAGSATALAAAPQLQVDPASGAALPTAGGKVELNLLCAGGGGQDCRGRVELSGRGSASGLGEVLARDTVPVRTGDTADPRLALDAAARDFLRETGPLPVTISISRPDGSTDSRRGAIVAMTPVPVGAPTVSRGGARISAVAGDNTLTYTWSKKLRAGTAAVMGDFRCPASHPFVARGGGIWYGYAGDVKLTASEDVGYAAFTDVAVKPFWSQDAFAGMRVWTMTGWYEGGLFRNSIWAPPFKEGSFRLSITCSSRPIGTGLDDSPADLVQEPYRGITPSITTFMPWVRSSRST